MGSAARTNPAPHLYHKIEDGDFSIAPAHLHTVPVVYDREKQLLPDDKHAELKKKAVAPKDISPASPDLKKGARKRGED